MAGRGSGTGVNLRWYPIWEYKKLADKEKKELGDWRKTPAGELAMKKLREDDSKKRKKPRSGVAGNGDGNGNTAKREKKFQKAVDKEAKKILASAMETKEADDEVFTARINAVIKKRGTSSEISATVVIKKKDDSMEKEAAENERDAKLSSVMNRISLNTKKKKVTVED